MSDQPQPKIPVKKADGSIVFMTMEEFREYKKQGSHTTPISAPVSIPPAAPISMAPTIPVPPPVSPAQTNPPTPPIEPLVVSPIQEPSLPTIPTVKPPEDITFAPPLPPVKTQVPSVVPEKIMVSPEPVVVSPLVSPAPVKEAAPQIIIPPSVVPPLQEPSIPEIPAPKKLEEGKVEVIEDPSRNTPPEEALRVLDEQALATTTPVVDFFVDEAKSKTTWKKEDHDSLLEESLEDKPLPTVAPGEDKNKALFETIKAQFPFPVSKDLEGRFESLVLSRLRDVRTVHDVEEYAVKTPQEGGLGLSEDQAKLLLAVIAAAQKLSGASQSTDSKPKRDRPAPSTTNENIGEINISAASPSSVPVDNMPKPQPVFASGSPSYKFPIAEEQYQFGSAAAAPSTPRVGKVVVHDVVPSTAQRKTMGPIDELHIFSLVEFRRLSPKTEAAKEIMKEKFRGLQAESYVLFLDARDAWRQSPLFEAYEDIVLAALTSKVTIQESMTVHPSGLTIAEFDALVEINKFLG